MGTENTKELAIRDNEDGSVEVELDEVRAATTEGGGTESTATDTPDDMATSGAASTAGEGEDATIRRDPDTDDEAAELARAANEEERDIIRERRRQERKDRRQRQRDRFDQMRDELTVRDRIIDEMRTRLDTYDRRNTGADLAALDARINREEENLTYLTSVIADGTKVGNGEAVAQATLQMTGVQQNLSQLKGYKTQLSTAARQPKQPQLDPRMVLNASTWMADNKWYNPASGDSDSRQVLLLDQRLAEEGFDPKHPDYWSELSKRVAQAMPHRAERREGVPAARESGYNPGTSRGKPTRSVVTGSSSNGVANSGRTGSSFRLSPERVQALKDAGMWDDSVARDAAIRKYRAYDAEQAAGANRR